MVNILSVGFGAFIGACLRYTLSRILPFDFPLATLISNIIVALLIGFIIGIERNIGDLPEQIKLLLTTGLLGGLSTFSTFSMETVTMLENHSYFKASANIILNVGLCLFCVFVGLSAAKLVFHKV